MLFTCLVAAAVCQSLAVRPERSGLNVATGTAKIGDFLESARTIANSTSSIERLVAVKAASRIIDRLSLQSDNATKHMSGDDKALMEKVVELLRTNIFGSMDASHTADQDSVAKAVAEIEQCNIDIAKRQSPVGDLGILHRSVKAKQTELDSLQEVVDEKTAANVSAWEALELHMSLISAPPAVPGFPARTEPALSVYFDQSRYCVWFSSQRASYFEKRDLFLVAHRALEQAIHEYNIAKAKRDVAYCDWRTDLEEGCAAFDECYVMKSAYYANVLKPTVMEDVKARIENFKAGETLITQINFLLANSDTRETPAVDTSRYEIDFPAAADRGLCDLSGLTSPEWVPPVECEDEDHAQCLDEEELMAALEKVLVKDNALESVTSCEQLAGFLANTTISIERMLKHMFATDEVDWQELSFRQGQVSALVDSADRKKCLPSVMRQVQPNVNELLLVFPSILSAATAVGKERFREAYLQVVTFQKGVLALAENLADRQLLLDIDKEHCPAPCGQCDNEQASAFGFRCLLRKADKDRLPDAGFHAVTCGPAKSQWFSWFKRYPVVRQCRVADWKESAFQHVHVSAMMSCTSASVLMLMNGEMSVAERHDLHKTCLEIEQGSTLPAAEQEAYKARLQLSDEAVQKKVYLAANVIFVYGLASGLAGLRNATRGNVLPPALLQGDQAAPFSAPFESFLTSNIRDADLAMYGGKELNPREETMNVLEACSDVYSVKSQNTFVDGVAPLDLQAMALTRGVESTVGQDLCPSQPTPSPNALGWLAKGAAGILAVLLGSLVGLALMVAFDFIVLHLIHSSLFFAFPGVFPSWTTYKILVRLKYFRHLGLMTNLYTFLVSVPGSAAGIIKATSMIYRAITRGNGGGPEKEKEVDEGLQKCFDAHSADL